MVPAVLRYRAFRDVWLASLASNAGSWLQIVASGWLILQLTDSPAAVGALALVTRAPAILLSTVAGQLADRFDRRAVGIWTFLLQAVAAGALALITWASGPEVWSIYVLTLPGRGRVRPGPARDARADPGARAGAAALAGRQPERRGHQRRAAGGAGDRRRDAGALRRHGVLRPERGLVPGPGARAAADPGAAGAGRRARGVGMREALAYAAGDDGDAPAADRDGGVHGPRLADPGARPGGRRPPGRRRPRGSACSSARWAAARSPAPGCSSACTAGGLPRHRALPIATVTFSAGMAVVALTPWLWLGPARHGLQRGLLDLDVRRHEHGDPAALAAGAARPDARPLPALGHRPDRHRLDGRRRRGRARGDRGRPSPGAPRCSPRGAPGACANPVAAIDGQARANRAIASNATSGTRPSTETK